MFYFSICAHLSRNNLMSYDYTSIFDFCLLDVTRLLLQHETPAALAAMPNDVKNNILPYIYLI